MSLSYQNSLKIGLTLIGILLAMLFMTDSIEAASLSSASATLTTSRPSASTPIQANALSGVGQLSVFNNSSRFLASDSAKTIRGAGIISNNNIVIASQSADLTTVYLGGTLGTGVGQGADVLFVPITSMHSIKFAVTTTIPSGGRIVLTYPGAGNNSASPSATTFAFNDLQNSHVVSNPASGCNTVVVSAPVITCTTNAIISAGTTVTVLVGCSAQSGGSCTTPIPRLINPTKSSATAGAADVWKIGIQTQDNSGSPVNLDNSTVTIGLVESVTVRATIDPSLTFSIVGVANGDPVNVNNTTGCLQTEPTNSGIGSTATEVGLGSLSVAPGTNTKLNNIAAQTLTVTTNGANGYSITATSSGRLTNSATGFSVNSSPTPLQFPASGAFFGLHACGLDADVTNWNSTGNSACNTYITGSTDPICEYAWPTQTGAILIAQDNSGPIGNTVAAGNGIVSVSYAATQDVTLPPGTYQSVVTYVATPSF